MQTVKRPGRMCSITLKGSTIRNDVMGTIIACLPSNSRDGILCGRKVSSESGAIQDAV